jgi:hypothetical protein
MFYYGTAWYICVIAWLERQFGLLADPVKQCMQTVLEHPLRTPVERVLRRLDGAAGGAYVTVADALIVPVIRSVHYMRPSTRAIIVSAGTIMAAAQPIHGLG